MKIKVEGFEGNVPFGYRDLVLARHMYSTSPLKGPREALAILKTLGYQTSNPNGLKAAMWAKAVMSTEVTVQLQTQWVRLKAR